MKLPFTFQPTRHLAFFLAGLIFCLLSPQTRADSLHLDFSKDDLYFQIVTPQHIGKIYLFNRPPGGLTLPFLEKLDLLLIRSAESNQSASDGFKLTLRGLEKFPAGWRINSGSSGIQWTGFPTDVADAKTLRGLAISEKMAAFKSITSEDDPTLLKLGESLVRFIRERDTATYEKELLLNSDTIWAMFEKSGQKGPTRQEMDEEVGKQVQEQVDVANKLLKQMGDAGIDLKQSDIQIKEASLERTVALFGVAREGDSYLFSVLAWHGWSECHGSTLFTVLWVGCAQCQRCDKSFQHCQAALADRICCHARQFHVRVFENLLNPAHDARRFLRQACS